MKKYIFPLLLLAGCQSTSQPKTNPLYWDAPGFFLNQMESLGKEAPAWEKIVRVEESREVKNLTTVAWDKELALFQEVDLNKTAYAGNIAETTTDSTTQYLVLEKNLPIRALKIIWESPQRPAQIDVTWHSENALYLTDRTLRATFSQGKLVGYTVQTYQKIWGLSPDIVHVEGKRKGK